MIGLSPGMAGKCVLAVGAHPDDVEVGMGGTVRRMANAGVRVVIAVVSVPSQLRLRMAEAECAAAALGATCRVLFPDASSRVEDHKSYEVVQGIDALVRELEPVAMFSHGRTDHHRDHLLTFEACQASQRLRFMDFYCYFPAACRPTPVTFSPQAFVDVTATIDAKIEAIRCHASQFQERGLDVGFQRDLARYYGGLSGTAYAEAFVVERMRLG